MTELTIEEVLKEGAAVKTMAEEIMEKTGAKGEPTGEAYAMAFSVIEMNQGLSRENADLLINSLNVWADVKAAVGKDGAKKLAAAQEAAMAKHQSELVSFLTGKKELAEVKGVLVEAVANSGAGKEMFAKHTGLAPKVAEYQGLTLELAKAAV